MSNLFYRYTLLRIGTLMNNKLPLPVSVLDLAWPLEQQDEAEPVKRGLIEIPIINLHTETAFAGAIRRGGVELTRASVVAVTIAKFSSMDGPLVTHDFSVCFRG